MARTRKAKATTGDEGDATAKTDGSKAKRWSGRMLNSAKKANAVTAANATTSPLLSLPLEIRNRIYRYALGGGTIQVTVGHNTNKNRRGGRPFARVRFCSANCTDEVELLTTARDSKTPDLLEPFDSRHVGCRQEGLALDAVKHSMSLLQTCRQIHQEAALIPFESNVFLFEERYRLAAFLAKLMPIQRRALRAIILDRAYKAFKTKAAARHEQDLIGVKEPIIGGYTLDSSAAECLRPHLLSVVTMFKRSNITRATCVATETQRCYYGEEMKHFTRPEKYASVCEEMETLLLSYPEQPETKEEAA